MQQSKVMFYILYVDPYINVILHSFSERIALHNFPL
jgi:hypothetical protein